MSHEELIAEKLSENFEKLRSSLDNLKSMLEDMALAVPALPDAAKLARAIAASLPEEPAPQPVEAVAPAPPPPALNNGLLYRMAAIEFAKSQSEILDQLMNSFQDFAHRGVFFIVRGDQAQAWNSFGFDVDVKHLKASMDQDPILRTVMGSRARMLLDNTSPAFIPAGPKVRRSLISPLLLKGKVAAFLYADSGEEGKLDHYSLDILIRTASLVIDIFPLRPKREPLPAALENQDIVLPGREPATLAEPEPEAMIFEDTGTLVSAAEAEADELPSNQTIQAEIPPEVIQYAPRVERPVEVPPEHEAELEEATVVAVEATQPESIPEVPIPPGEEKLHEDAQRFARLLVQEIALYHPKEVEQGKRGRNLYALLKDDIDRSREAYEHRFQKPSIQTRRYFDKALGKYLADGDESLLGS